MKSRTFAVAALLLTSLAHANQMHNIAPTSYIIAGRDIDGEDAYSIALQLERSEKETTIKSLEVQMYGEVLSVSSDILRQAVNPNVSAITFTNDAGVFGYYIYIDVPFGQIGSCREARKDKLTKSIHITNLGKRGSRAIEARIYDPCKKP